jgi:hypothetical protein
MEQSCGLMEESQKDGMFLCKYQTLDLYMILCHLFYIYSIFDVGDMSQEQKQQRQCSVSSNY